MNDLQKLKQTFDEIGVPYCIEDAGCGWINLTISSRNNILFEFYNGKMFSCP